MGAWFPWGSLGRQLAACVLMGAAAAGLATFGDWSAGPLRAANWPVFIALLGVAAALYAAATLALREEQAQQWVTLFAKLGRRVRRLAGGAKRP
jgi:hypothetical protein